MTKNRASVRAFALEAGIDLDEALIALWYAGFDYVTGPEDSIRKRDASRARRALGLATRRELASPPYWCELLSLDAQGLAELFAFVGVEESGGKRLSKKTIHRLKAEAHRRGLWPMRAEAEVVPANTVEAAPLEWKVVGRERDLKYMTIPQVELIHQALVDDFSEDADPIAPPGVKSMSLLGSAVGRQTTAISNILKYPTVEMSAAALLHALVHNHPFHNGNKRTALVSTLVFLDENGLMLVCDEDELFKFVLQLAQHAIVSGPQNELSDREVLVIAEWLTSRCRWIEKGDRPVPWRRLRRILSDYYECEFSFPKGVGNRINITRRVVSRRRLFGGLEYVVLQTQTSYKDEGRDVEGNTVNKIRHDLQLDDQHGVDSAAFYDRVPAPPGEFIVRYRKTIRRLAKV